jgi:CubicO group peptidase (beta-lactamase class C family)
MTKNYTGGKEKRGIGWWINPYPGILSEYTFGHTGFTGTMVMVDPKNDLLIVLLTNSVHPKVRLGIMPKIRKKIVQILMEAQNKKGRANALPNIS